jgi:hypothetical protein
MSDALGPLEIECDAPSYSIVKACHMVGFETPEDVRWVRMSHQLVGDASGWGLFHNPVRSLLGRGTAAVGQTCSCGRKLPALEKYTFTYLNGREASYMLAQCRGCRSVYWDEAT